MSTVYLIDQTFCITLTFKNSLKACFSKKYLITIQTRPTQIRISILLIEKAVFNGFLNIIGVQNQLPIFIQIEM